MKNKEATKRAENLEILPPLIFLPLLPASLNLPPLTSPNAKQPPSSNHNHLPRQPKNKQGIVASTTKKEEWHQLQFLPTESCSR